MTIEQQDQLKNLVEGFCEIMEHCSVSNGMCCCGDDMKNHESPMNCGHSPRDEGEYRSTQLYERAKKLLEELNG